MARICFYFQLHQPYRLRDYTVFDLGQKSSYFEEADTDLNRQIFRKVAHKSYLPMLGLLLELTKTHPEFVFSLSCSGIFLEQAQSYEPGVIALLQDLVETGQVELLAETYYHSLASLYSPAEFRSQVLQHERLVETLFGIKPSIFRNTELIYSNQIATLVTEMGYEAMLTEAVDRCLHGRSRTQVFSSSRPANLPLLLKHAQLSDDIAFRFSNKQWEEHPLTAEKYVHWVDSYWENDLLNLFMDFETFGEHQWSDTGIFDFFRHMVSKHLENKNSFVRPSDVIENLELYAELPVYDVPDPISWADIDRDLTAWRGNTLQDDSLRLIYSLEEKILSTQDEALITDWRRLQTSDHFYYMCVKWAADGDVHKYFSPYDSPFAAYNRFTTIVADLQDRLAEVKI